jgi:hypothetical protein
MGHKGHYGHYSGNHPRFSKRRDEEYDAKMAYDKDLTGKARLHYLENDIADKKSPANSHCSPMHNTDRAKKLREKAIKISERSGAERGDEYDYENPRVTDLLERAKNIDERSARKVFMEVAKAGGKIGKVFDERSGEERRKDIDEMIYERPDINRESSSLMRMEGKGCAKSEGGSGCVVKRGDEYVILNNKKGGIFQSGFKSKQAAERSLAGYHANK